MSARIDSPSPIIQWVPTVGEVPHFPDFDFFTHGVYVLEHSESGSVYVGASTLILTRWSAHVRLLRKGKHHNRMLQEAWGVYGLSAFRFLLIEEIERGRGAYKHLSNAEKRWIAWYQARTSNTQVVYNISKSSGTVDAE